MQLVYKHTDWLMQCPKSISVQVFKSTGFVHGSIFKQVWSKPTSTIITQAYSQFNLKCYVSMVQRSRMPYRLLKFATSTLQCYFAASSKKVMLTAYLYLAFCVCTSPRKCSKPLQEASVQPPYTLMHSGDQGQLFFVMHEGVQVLIVWACTCGVGCGCVVRVHECVYV